LADKDLFHVKGIGDEHPSPFPKSLKYLGDEFYVVVAMRYDPGLTASENTELSASQLPVNSPQTQCSKVGVEKARGKTVVRE